MQFEDLKNLAIALPENILKEKWSGHFAQARKLIAHAMADENTTYAMRCRLELELNNMDIFERRYVLSREEALAQIRKRIPDFSEAEFDQLEIEDKMDCAYIDGQKRYLNNAVRNLFNVYRQFRERTAEGDHYQPDAVDAFVDHVQDGDRMAAHIHLRHIVGLEEEAVEEGKLLHVHIPVPQEREQVRNLQICKCEPQPKAMAGIDAPQSTAYFEAPATRNQDFSVEYAFDSVMEYCDMAKADLAAVEKAAAEGLPAGMQQYLVEEAPHIVFTPFLRALAAELKGEETNPLKIARRFYDFITTKVEYRFVRDYAGIDHLAEYCALNRRGDCGIQALLFITLCRIAGIPARWQSGLDAKPGDVGEHDWALFYIPSLGWRFTDPSYGGSAHRKGRTARWNFFFGNADPYRIPFNEGFQKPFTPAKKHWRMDPYDNQCGEIEYDEHGVSARDFRYDLQEIEIKKID